ncbi:MAG: haloacid dehalogenase type II [Burkholderiales bacterium]|nr:haloacid dehalogenase type II [Burkholderiales bacterium]
MTTPVRALVFDAYGTLFDVHSVVAECERHFPGRGTDLSKQWRVTQLEYTWLRSLMGRYEDFEHVTGGALAHACATLKLPLTEAARSALMGSYLRLTPYPEVPAALRSFGGRKRAILSNGSPRMLEAVVDNAHLTDAFDAVLSVDALRIYKPHPSVYQLAVDRLGVPVSEIAFVSSNFWDVSGATSFGFRTFWINRAGNVPDPLGFQPAAVLTGLDQLAAVL